MSQQLLHHVYKEPRNGEGWSRIVDLLVHYHHEASLSARTRGMACSYPSSFQSDCFAIATSLDIANATVWFSEYVPAGTNLSLLKTT